MTNTDQYTLSPQLLLTAYSQGYFPMPDPSTSEILWFRPNPRAIIPLNKFHVSRSLKKKILLKKSWKDALKIEKLG
jgi:leucyl/phenylalanyl-tRNA--protein transferase